MRATKLKDYLMLPLREREKARLSSLTRVSPWTMTCTAAIHPLILLQR